MGLFDFFHYPKALYPTVIKGHIEGLIRCESLEGGEIYLEPKDSLIDFKPFVHTDGKTYAVTHLQKKSKKGFLLMAPYIYHWWSFSKLQEQNSEGTWLPGTEKGIYWRTPGWRWDVAGTKGKHWIFTKGYFGTHLD